MGTPTYDLIASIDFTTGNSGYTPTFSNIPTNYKHLELVMSGKQSPNFYTGLIMNGTTSANYEWFSLFQDNGTVYGDRGGAGETYIKSQDLVTESVGNIMGAIRYTFFDYTRSGNKVVMFDWGNGTTSHNGFSCGLYYGDTNPVTSITLYSGYVWTEGRLDLYGLAG